jgi:hypothetical protein
MRRRGPVVLLLLIAISAIVLLSRDQGVAPPPERDPTKDVQLDAVPEDLAGPETPPGQAPPATEADGPAATRPASSPAAPGTITIRGSIVRADGRTVKGTHAVLHSTQASRHRRWEATISADGSFEITGVPDKLIGNPACITAGCEGLLPRMYRFGAEAARSGRVRIVLRPPVRYTGRFVDEEGKPVAGSVLSAFYPPFHNLYAEAGGEGRFSFLAPAEWPGLIHVTHGAAPNEILVLPADAVEDTDLGDRVVYRGLSIEGTVVDERGEPALGTVDLYGRTGGKRVASARVDRQGRFRFVNVGAGRYDAYCNTEGTTGRPLVARVPGLVAGQRDVRLVLRPAIMLVIRLVDATTEKPVRVDIAGLWVKRAGDPDDLSWSRDVRGMRSQISALLDRPGSYEFGVGTPFHEWEKGRVDVAEGEARVEVEVRLRPADDG